MELTFLNISQAEIPCEKIYLINGAEYIFLFQYNDAYDFYTVTIKDMNDTVILVNKLSYLMNAFSSVMDGLPDVQLLPTSLKEFEQTAPFYNRLGVENFDNVRICLL